MDVLCFLIITNNPVVNDIKDTKVFFLDSGANRLFLRCTIRGGVVHLFSPGIISDTINTYWRVRCNHYMKVRCLDGNL